jgi:SpoIIAA-like
MDIAMVPDSGQSTVDFESPDTTVWRFRGDVSEEIMRSLTFREKRLIEGRPYLLKLVDVSRAGNVAAGARKAGAEKVHDVPVMAVAIFGANFAIRVVANLVIRAGSMMRKIDTVPTQFFETEDRARAWLATKREEIQKNPSIIANHRRT